MDTKKLVATYVKIRDARAELKAKYEDDDAKLKAQLGKIEQVLLKMTDDLGVTSLKTEAGTATKTQRTRYWAADWDAFKDFMRQYDALDLVERRVHQGNFKEFMETHPDVVPPVNADSTFAITIRRGK
jgi:hypothetical protein